MNHYLYEQQAKIKLNARFKEGREWRKWRIAHPAGPGLVTRVMSFLRDTGSRVHIALRGKAARVLEAQSTNTPEATVETALSTHAQ